MTRHMSIQCAAVLLTLVGGIIGLVMVPLSNHFKTTHGIIGIVVIALALAQPFLGFCCVSLPMHRAVGYLSMALGAAAMMLGLLLNGVQSLVILYACFLGISITSILVIEFRKNLEWFIFSGFTFVNSLLLPKVQSPASSPSTNISLSTINGSESAATNKVDLVVISQSRASQSK
jgi:hypothetical protein